MVDNNSYERTGSEVAVIGMAGKFPGAASVDELWDNLKNGVESITFFSREELEDAGIDPNLLDNPKYVRARGYIENYDHFDAAFFGYTALEAELMDPQIRNFYEIIWWALENAGYSPDNCDKSIGVFAGATNNRNWEGRIILDGHYGHLGGFASDHLIDRDFLSTRMAYRLNLTGPAIALKTACSTGLVAVDLGCRSILTGQCDMALSGAISIPDYGKSGYLYQDGMVESPDGHCRAFDAKSKGVVFCDGGAVVVLKRLDAAIEDGDNILAVIKGTAINNDGSAKGAYSAPSVNGQSAVIRAAHQISGVDPETITYVEAHGTGTVLGDPIEVEALTQAFDTNKKQYCGIGSLKTNIGHLDTAAGIAGLIKVILSLMNKMIPPSLNFETPNPKIDFENSPFYVNSRLKEWKRGDTPLRAGISSFGVGGTNAHIILEEAPPREPSTLNGKEQLIVLSAKNETALNEMTQNFRRHLEENPGINLADVAYSLQMGRTAHKRRQMFTASSVEEAIAILSPVDESTPFNVEKVARAIAGDNVRPVFMFSGQGSQYIDMGLDLYRTQPVFASHMDQCLDIFRNYRGIDLKSIIYPGDDEQERERAEKRLKDTEITQPALFCFEYALAGLLMEWGIKPHALIGHSIGEYTAACLSGVFSLEDAVKLVALRGKLMQQMKTGSMLSIPLPETEIKPFLNDQLELAAINAPSLCVISGTDDAIMQLEKQLKAQGHEPRILHTSHAFHSQSMDPMLDDFKRDASEIKFNAPSIPYISNLTGTWIRAEEAVDPAYWAAHLRRAVRFADGLGQLLKDEHILLVEVGPGKALSTFARQHKDKKPDQPVLNLIRHPKDNVADSRYLLDKIGRLWLFGQTIDFSVFHRGERRLRVPLPRYPFQRHYYRNTSSNVKKSDTQALDRKQESNRWYYIPSWKRTSFPAPVQEERLKTESAEPLNWLFFTDDCGLGVQLAEKLGNFAQSVIHVQPASTFARPADNRFELDPRQPDHYDTLIQTLAGEGKAPHRVVHLWNVTPDDNRRLDTDGDEFYLDRGFYSLVQLAQAVGKQGIGHDMQISVFTNHLHEVLGDEELCPEKAPIMGPLMVIPLEFPNIKCRSVDIVLSKDGGRAHEKLMERLVNEICADIAGSTVIAAYRHNHRLEKTYEQAELPEPNGKIPPLRENGVYLITGGLGGIGLVLARRLAQQVNARLVLTSRTSLPSRDKWEQWPVGQPTTDPIGQKINIIRELEAMGAQISIIAADTTDADAMRNVITSTHQKFGPIDGVIHTAGVPGGGVIQIKDRQTADKVLLPKVRGTRVLDRLLQEEQGDRQPDFILLCSSIGSILPDAGQVDYFSANAFMDAYAYYKTAKDDVFTVSVNWDPWQEVGMAVEAASDTVTETETHKPVPLEPPHPLLETVVPIPNGGKYFGHVSLEKTWPLSEHKISETEGLMPGTGYLEMARAALNHHSGPGPVEYRDANFFTPLVTETGQERIVELTLQKTEPGDEYYNFLVESSISGQKSSRQRHSSGRIKLMTDGNTPNRDLDVLKNRFEKSIRMDATGQKGERRELVKFGPRWQAIQNVWPGKNEALVELRLADDFHGDLDSYKLHPALMDAATGFLFSYLYKGSAYIPFVYNRLRMYRPMPPEIMALCRLAEVDVSKESLSFDIVIMDNQGRVCFEADQFTMLEVSENLKGRFNEMVQTSAQVTSGNGTENNDTEKEVKLNDKQKWLKRIGILPEEGMNAFDRIIRGHMPQVIVSTVHLPARIDAMNEALARKHSVDTTDDDNKKTDDTMYPRPELGTLFVSPRTDTEKKIADIWRKFLRLDRIGVHDDFFELGGDSLKIVQLNDKLRRALKIDIPVAIMFRYMTINAFAKYLDEREGAAKPASKEQDRSQEIEKGKNRLKARKRRR